MVTEKSCSLHIYMVPKYNGVYIPVKNKPIYKVNIRGNNPKVYLITECLAILSGGIHSI